MIIQTIHHLTHLWLQRPIGRMAGLLLLSLMVCSVTPGVKAHAHPVGMDEQGHVSKSTVAAQPLLDDRGSPEPVSEELFHVHDMPKPSTALLMLPLLPGYAASAELNSTVVMTILFTASTPPYRPPIV